MPFSPHITLGGDYLTPYYADQRLPDDVRDKRAVWDAQLKTDTNPPRARLGRLASRYFRLREKASHGDTNAHRDTIRMVLGALGYPVPADDADDGPTVTFTTDTSAWDLPVEAVVYDGIDTPVLVAVATAAFTDNPTLLLTDTGLLTAPGHAHGDPGKPLADARTVADVAQKVFAAHNSPRFVLACAGGAVALIDYHHWHDGKWLGADVDGMLGANDNRTGGQLDQFAYLFGIDATHPTDATPLLDAAVDASNKQAVGVSESLRDAVRSGVELIANEVLYDMRERQKVSVFGEGGGATINPTDLTRQSIRWMYRLVVLLYAEARPAIGILPTDHPIYASGYGIERLRDLSLVDLRTPDALDGTHFHDSLTILFNAVNEGHNRRGTDQALDDTGTGVGIEFEPLQSRLFNRDSCPLIDKAQLRDRILQQIIAGLCYAPGDKNKGRQTVSYANLEVNQLGAVYEGLMAYTGFFALEEDLYEVAARTSGDTAAGVTRSADPSRGSWTIPVSKADEYPDNVFVTTYDPLSGEHRRVRHPKGSFVFRLAGRDRKRSASFYTPSVLTEFTVRHALEEWQEANDGWTAADILNLTVLEPALGSGAFANEAISQLADLYLRKRQAETGLTLPADARVIETRKLRAHFAINQTYGVDLNDTAVELAEVGLWLNAMHPGLAAPSLTARLKAGNSLIGARRATYTPAQATKQPWKGKPAAPDYQHPHDIPFGTATGIHHFLLPGEGWGFVAKPAKSNLLREFDAARVDAVWAWRNAIQKKPKTTQIDRAKSLAGAVERAWVAAEAQVSGHLASQSRPIDIWNRPPDFEKPSKGHDSPSGETNGWLDTHSGAYRRLRLVMDAWCAFWVRVPDHTLDLPTLDEWFDCIDHLIGSDDYGDGTLLAMIPDDREGRATQRFGKGSVAEAIEKWPWLADCQAIATELGFFHWDLDYAPVIATGGFDLQVGNPPWVRLDWDEPEALSEHDPWWGVTKLKDEPSKTKKERRTQALGEPATRHAVLSEAAENLGLASILGSDSLEPALRGMRTNLYMNFMTGTWRRRHPTGVVALVHPESHFTDPKGGSLRHESYMRLRRHWGFVNEGDLFEDIHHETEFGVHVYASPQTPDFQQMTSALYPSTIDQSLQHDGHGALPGLKHPDGSWDIRAHSNRIIRITDAVLADWVHLFDEPGTPAFETRLVRPLTVRDLDMTRTLARTPHRLRARSERRWTTGFNEKEQKDDDTIAWRTHRWDSLTDVVLQGPHVLNAAPFAQQPRPNCKSNLDWDPVDYTAISDEFVPRTNYEILAMPKAPTSRFPFWDGKPNNLYVREAHREYVGSAAVRTLQSCLLPPGPSVVGSLVTISLDAPRLLLKWAGLCASIPYDYMVKVSGVSHIKQYLTDALPFDPAPHPLDADHSLRTARLNMIQKSYSGAWSDTYSAEWTSCESTFGPDPHLLGEVTGDWSSLVPLRVDHDRWRALSELDAIAAIMLGLGEDDLIQMYRSQFPVLGMYENSTVFDSEGAKVCKHHQAHEAKQAFFEADLRDDNKTAGRGQKGTGLWDRVETYRDGDTDVDLAYLVPPFRRADRELAMRTAFRHFAPLAGRDDLMGTSPLGDWEVWG